MENINKEVAQTLTDGQGRLMLCKMVYATTASPRALLGKHSVSETLSIEG